MSSIPGTKITQKNYSNIWAADRIEPWVTIIDKSSNSESDKEQNEFLNRIKMWFSFILLFAFLLISFIILILRTFGCR